MNNEKKNESIEPKTTEQQIEKKVPVIIELGESNLDDVAGGMAYRCQPVAHANY
jgi:hypothetical protein